MPGKQKYSDNNCCIFTNSHDEECDTAGRPIYLLIKCNVQNNIIFTKMLSKIIRFIKFTQISLLFTLC